MINALNLEESPGISNLRRMRALKRAGASIEQVPSPPLQENVDDMNEPATARARERTDTATNSSPNTGDRCLSPAGTNTLRQSLAEDSSSEEAQDDLKVLRLRARNLRRKLF